MPRALAGAGAGVTLAVRDTDAGTQTAAAITAATGNTAAREHPRCDHPQAGRRLIDPGTRAQRIGHTSAQVLIRWAIQRDTIVIPKSTHRQRIEENGRVFDFELSDGDLAALDALDQTGGTEAARERKWW